ncbi:MAG TPA: deoxyribodipyrimidine photo-lyase [Rhodanobacter sp.]|nr:deoxyribodipyrimidine photo-lyase [Rhodanobacter sp.]
MVAGNDATLRRRAERQVKSAPNRNGSARAGLRRGCRRLEAAWPACKAVLQEQSVPVRSFNAVLCCEPWRVATRQGAAYGVFTPFWRKLRWSLFAFG